MASSARFAFSMVGTAGLGLLLAWNPQSSSVEDGYPITNQTVIDRCSRCHVVDDEGRMSRISYMRKTPEGWQTSIRRMMALHGARLNQADAREIVRYRSPTRSAVQALTVIFLIIFLIWTVLPLAIMLISSFKVGTLLR